jgi:hypothetical protein
VRRRASRRHFRLLDTEFTLPMSGTFNVRNAAMAIAAAHFYQIPLPEIAQAVAGLRGRAAPPGNPRRGARRHHHRRLRPSPTAMRETLQGLRHRFPHRRLWALFEPRSNTTRRAVFQKDLPAALALADGVFVAQVARWSKSPSRTAQPGAGRGRHQRRGRPGLLRADADAIVAKAQSAAEAGRRGRRLQQRRLRRHSPEVAGTWNLAFFVAPTSAAVKQEINDFQADNLDPDAKVYNYPTPLQMAATEDQMPAADPRAQNWPGMTPALLAPPPAPPTDPNNPNPPATAQADPPDDGPPTLQTYLDAFAKSANIWILVPGSWSKDAPSAPPANSSIISAVKNFVGSMRGAVQEVIVLRVGHGGRGGRGMFGNMDVTQERIDNAINGLPDEYQAPVREQLQNDVKALKEIQLATPDQRPQLFRQFMQAHRGGDNNWRRSPQKRAQMYARLVSNRETAQGKK